CPAGSCPAARSSAGARVAGDFAGASSLDPAGDGAGASNRLAVTGRGPVLPVLAVDASCAGAVEAGAPDADAGPGALFSRSPPDPALSPASAAAAGASACATLTASPAPASEPELRLVSAADAKSG